MKYQKFFESIGSIGWWIKLIPIKGRRWFFIDLTTGGRDGIGIGWNIIPTRFGIYIHIIWSEKRPVS